MADETNMYLEANRLASYTKWPLSKRCKAKPKNMAAAGFYMIEGTEDLVRCVYCQKELDGWEPKDDPMKEHERHSPACPRLNLHLESARLETFKTWPHKEGDLKATIEEFAKAGFWHIPESDSMDEVCCFKCKKCLGGWEYDDDPIEEHKRSKRCTFVWALIEELESKQKKAAASAAATAEEEAEAEEKDKEEAEDVAVNEDTEMTADGEAEEDKEENFADTECTENASASEEVEKPAEIVEEVTESDNAIKSEEMKAKKQAAAKKATGKKATKKVAATKKPVKKATKVAEKKASPKHNREEDDFEEPVTVKKLKTKKAVVKEAEDTSEMEIQKVLDDPTIQDMTVEDFLRSRCESQIHQVVRRAEEMISSFRESAKLTRTEIACM